MDNDGNLHFVATTFGNVPQYNIISNVHVCFKIWRDPALEPLAAIGNQLLILLPRNLMLVTKSKPDSIGLKFIHNELQTCSHRNAITLKSI